MRTLEETQSRWQATIGKCGTLKELQQAVKNNGSASPCLSGCRSVCWKVFLVFEDVDTGNWSSALQQSRSHYEERRDHFLKYIRHPEALAEVSADPLADDPESPWTTVRQDETARAEILQDVRRLPDEANYHDSRMQQIVLDILFIYCKLNPDRGGYRQGMHELLAPIVHVLEQDALDRSAVKEATLDTLMLDVLDSNYIEHDAYTLFSQLMEHAKSFYEVIETDTIPDNSNMQGQSSSIVERSRQIHEIYLHMIDPDLAMHLKNIEILPQIFLIRWIRLLYNREFPFTQFLILWDSIFAVDPSLQLIDMISCAMLLRIRWQLLEGDYSVCLQNLLKYPIPDGEHGPHTFVDDAIYLKEHMNAKGGRDLIVKYSGRAPAAPGSVTSTVTPSNVASLNLQRQRAARLKASLPSPTKFIQQQQGSVETFLQGAAKEVLERGEKLGLNQAVRDAVGELRRNMQNLNETRTSSGLSRSNHDAAKAVALLEMRNKQLATILEETVANLKAASESGLEDKAKSLELIEIAAAKAQLVQIYLQDSTMEVPNYGNTNTVKEEPKEETSKVSEAKRPTGTPEAQKPLPPAPTPPQPTQSAVSQQPKPQLEATKVEKAVKGASKENINQEREGAQLANAAKEVSASPALVANVTPSEQEIKEPPKPVSMDIPTRSTLAQSSFSWMLEPDESTSPLSPTGSAKSPSFPNKNRRSNHASREKNSFLFGDASEDIEGDGPLGSKSGQLFGMESISKPKGP